MPYNYRARFTEVKPYIHRFTLREDAIARGIAKFYEEKGYSPERARQIGYATMNRIKNMKGKIKVGRKSFKI